MKNKKMVSFFIWLGVIGGLLVVGSLAGYRIYSGKASKDKEVLATKERNEIKDGISGAKNNQEEQTKILTGKLEESQKEILDEVQKVSKLQPDIKIENSPNAVIQFNEKGDNIVNRTYEKFKPEILFFENETQRKKDNSGNIITKYFFGSDQGFPLMNPSVHIFFDNPFIQATAGITGQGMVVTGSLEKKAGKTNKDFKFETNMLQAGNYIFIETTSVVEINVMNVEVRLK